jgi:dUTPase
MNENMNINIVKPNSNRVSPGQYPVKLANVRAKVPKRIDPLSPEFEVYSAESSIVIIHGHGGMAVIDTGVYFNPDDKDDICLAIENIEKYGIGMLISPRITPLWSLATTHNVYAISGEFKSGETAKILVINNAATAYIISPGDAIANVVFDMVVTPSLTV